MDQEPSSNARASLKIAGIYALAGFLWILLSDKALELFITSPRIMQQVQTVKGWFYVLVTALLVYLLVRGHLHRLSKARKRLEESRQDLQITLRAAGMGYWNWKRSGMTYSRLAQEILAASPDNLPLTLAQWREIIHPDDHADIFTAISDHYSSSSDVFSGEFRIRFNETDWKWIMGVGRIVERDGDGTPVRAMGIIMDISDRKRAEREIVRSRLEAEHANRSKSDFLASMSHELRTPLNGVLAMLQLLDHSELDKESKEFLHTAYDSGQSLLRIINNLLSLTSAEAGKFRLHEEVVNLERLLETLLTTMNTQVPPAVSLQSELAKDIPSEVRVDAGKVEQICYNLIGNALKNTQKGNVTLALTRLPHIQGGKRLYLITVEDAGCGISAEALDTIFDPFVQVDSPHNSAKHGAGLGLGIVQRLAGLMGGGICLDTEEGVGTTVAVLLPVDERIEAVSGAERSEKVTGRHILVVDDDRISRMAVTRFLKKLGHTGDAAADGADALTMLRDREYDCVLMDIQMPGINGLEATRRIRASRSLKTRSDVPIIAMTAHVLEEDRHQFTEADMDGFIPKPMQIEALADEIARVLSPTLQD